MEQVGKEVRRTAKKIDNRTDEEKEQARKNSLANLKPFKPVNQLTDEEKERQLAISKKGYETSTISLKHKASMNQLAKSLLNQSISREQAKRILGDDQQLITDDRELTVAQVLNVAMVQEAVKGNVKAYEAIRDTSGQAPKTIQSVEIDIMTDTDRQLLENLKSRLNTINA